MPDVKQVFQEMLIVLNILSTHSYLTYRSMIIVMSMQKREKKVMHHNS